MSIISIHAPARGATWSGIGYHYLIRFQPTHPQGVRRLGAVVRLVNLNFNPRTRKGCDQRRHQTQGLISAFQSTHPQGVRQGLYYIGEVTDSISIHAPARGATTSGAYSPMLSSNFNPRTRKGCDKHVISGVSILLHFNPRTRKGCDVEQRTVKEAKHISIHAPARGATAKMGSAALPSRYFNPRTRKGCDIPITVLFRRASHFNPRTRKGCDVGTPIEYAPYQISIHAPARGATHDS